MESLDAKELDSLAEFVRRVLAVACGIDAAALDDCTELADLGLDSLTLVTVLAQVEAVYGVDFSTADTLAALGASNVTELLAAISRAAAGARGCDRARR